MFLSCLIFLSKHQDRFSSSDIKFLCEEEQQQQQDEQQQEKQQEQQQDEQQQEQQQKKETLLARVRKNSSSRITWRGRDRRSAAAKEESDLAGVGIKMINISKRFTSRGFERR